MKEEELCGFINIFKPTGMTSFDVVKKVKNILHVKRVGHLGTLDPAAAGVLPIAVGRATKFFDYFLNKDKTYYAMVKFGVQTDTLDSFGKVVCRKNVEVSRADIESVLGSFVRRQMQVPPKYSAVKINGKKAYELARQGEEFEIQPKEIEVYNLKLIDQTDKDLFLFRADVSAGTYIRTLFNDLAQALGTVATTPVIIRTKSGCFEMSDEVTLEEFAKQPKLARVEEIFKDKPVLEISDDLAKKVLNGVKISEAELKNAFGEHKKVQNLHENDEFLIKFAEKIVGLYKIENQKVIPIVFL